MLPPPDEIRAWALAQLESAGATTDELWRWALGYFVIESATQRAELARHLILVLRDSEGVGLFAYHRGRWTLTPDGRSRVQEDLHAAS